MPLHLTKLAAASHRTMRWKNGGGTTIEIARSPASSSLDDFDWRVSMARVEAAGPFSRFPGVDRTIAILDGDGIALTVDGAEIAPLDRRSAPFSFPGDAVVSGTLVGGPVEDLNVMTRRARFEQSLRRLDGVGSKAATVEIAGEISFLVVAGGVVAVREGGSTFVLGARDVLRIEGSGEIEVEREDGGDVLLVEVQRV